MSGRGNMDKGKGKLQSTRGRRRVIHPGSLQIHTDRVRQQSRNDSSSTLSPPHVSPILTPMHASSSIPAQSAHTANVARLCTMMPNLTCRHPEPSMPPSDESHAQPDHLEEVEEEEETHLENEDDLNPQTPLPTNFSEVIEKDNNGKIIIHPYGKSVYPNSEAVTKITEAIKSQFRDPMNTWSDVSEQTKEYWWNQFKDACTWDSQHNIHMRNYFEKKGGERLRGIVAKVRQHRDKKGKPNWMGEEAWSGLTTIWDSTEYKKKCEQNKANLGSTKGGAVHTSGRRAHSEVARFMARELGRSIDPDELFLATHTRNTGGWVDDRTATTYTQYHDRLKEISSQSGSASVEGEYSTTEVDGRKKLQLWKEVAGGKTRGRIYGTGDLVSQVHLGSTSLTDHVGSAPSFDTLQLMAENERLRQQTQSTIEELARANERVTQLESTSQYTQATLNTVMECLADLEKSRGNVSSSGRRSHEATHPDYEDDDDEQHGLDDYHSPPHYRRRNK